VSGSETERQATTGLILQNVGSGGPIINIENRSATWRNVRPTGILFAQEKALFLGGSGASCAAVGKTKENAWCYCY